MKNKGISLIVLIITCVVIIILATAIIVNIANSNIIGNANIAVLSNDFQTFNEQLRLYKSEQLVETKGKFKSGLLNANYDNILIDEEEYKEGNIYDILTSLKGSKYDKKIYIQDGKIVVDAKQFTTSQINSLKKLGIESIDASLKLKIVTTSGYTNITAKMILTLGNAEKYYFKLGEDGEYIESDTNEYTFEGLNINTSYTVYMKVLKADGEESIEYTKEIITKDITGEVTITKNPNLSDGEYTNSDVKVNLSYGADIINGYALQYKTSEKDWTSYTEEITITKNTTVYGRLYNVVDDIEKASNSSTINYIDKTAPVVNSFAYSSLEDDGFDLDIKVTEDIGLKEYVVYVNNAVYKTINKPESEMKISITDRSASTAYTCYVNVVDRAGNVTKSSSIKVTTPKDSKGPTIEVLDLTYVDKEYAKVTLKVEDKTGVNAIMKNGSQIQKEYLEKSDANVYICKIRNNGTVKITASDTLGNVNEEGVTLTISGLQYVSIVSYTDKMNVAEFDLMHTGDGKGTYYDYAATDYFGFYKSQNGYTYLVFKDPVNINNGDKINVEYAIKSNGGGVGKLLYSFITDPSTYNTATYETIVSNTGTAFKYKEASIEYTGESGTYYFVLAINHYESRSWYNTDVRLLDFKICNK